MAATIVVTPLLLIGAAPPVEVPPVAQIDPSEFARRAVERLGVEGDRLRRSWKDGTAKLDGYLEDYAFFVDGLLALYAATFEYWWIEEANQLAITMINEFYDAAAHAFYDTGRSHEALVARPRDSYDSATPSGTSVA